MKIGIITQALEGNYGGILQNYALQQVLIRMGHEPVTLDWDTSFRSIYKTPFYVDIYKRLLYPLVASLRGRELYLPTLEEKRIINKNNDTFIDKNISRTIKFINAEQITEYVKREGIETFIVGSDQVWRPKYNADAIHQMFLYFAKDLNVKRISYAASFGTDEWEFPQELAQQVLPLIEKFDGVSVREDSAVALCKKHFHINATQVVDPTLLLNKEDYVMLIQDIACSFDIHEKVLFHYLLDPTEEKLAFVAHAAKALDMRCRTVLPKHTPETRTKGDIKTDIEGCILPGPIAWLNGFNIASMVICDSFHGCVFSIIFNVPFWVVGNPDRGMSRFYSLLAMFGLTSRLIDIKDFNAINLCDPIDWKRVNAIRQERITTSLSFLTSMGL